ncbi:MULTISPECIES: hypothetical protein [unclassified Stappia]|uniref:hypothetical protein n=1 Tax=unclassified Stappia TaxID=2629676 RepID=UPI0016437384|nr:MULTISPECIES: hypothetical protein [unclassified Stappia]
MWKLAAILFIVIGPTLAGTFALVPMTFYGINAFAPWLLAVFAGVGALVAVPISLLVARRIDTVMGPGPRKTA